MYILAVTKLNRQQTMHETPTDSFTDSPLRVVAPGETPAQALEVELFARPGQTFAAELAKIDRMKNRDNDSHAISEAPVLEIPDGWRDRLNHIGSMVAHVEDGIAVLPLVDTNAPTSNGVGVAEPHTQAAPVEKLTLPRTPIEPPEVEWENAGRVHAVRNRAGYRKRMDAELVPIDPKPGDEFRGNLHDKEVTRWIGEAQKIQNQKRILGEAQQRRERRLMGTILGLLAATDIGLAALAGNLYTHDSKTEERPAPTGHVVEQDVSTDSQIKISGATVQLPELDDQTPSVSGIGGIRSANEKVHEKSGVIDGIKAAGKKIVGIVSGVSKKPQN